MGVSNSKSVASMELKPLVPCVWDGSDVTEGMGSYCL